MVRRYNHLQMGDWKLVEYGRLVAKHAEASGRLRGRKGIHLLTFGRGGPTECFTFSRTPIPKEYNHSDIYRRGICVHKPRIKICIPFVLKMPCFL